MPPLPLPLPLLHRRALVCGSTRGIGQACAELLATRGASVILLARNGERLAQTREALPRPDQSQRHSYLVADFGEPDQVGRVLADALAGDGPVHVLVNNTGGPRAGPVAGAQPEEFVTAFRNHLLCNHLLAQTVIPGMRAAGYGRIINVSTSVRQPIKGLGVSNTIRGAVASWAKTLSSEVAPFGITVNNVLPGATRTSRLDQVIHARVEAAGQPRETIEREMLAEIPLGRFGEPVEIAAAVAFLASPEAGYITGVSLPVDGGRISSL